MQATVSVRMFFPVVILHVGVLSSTSVGHPAASGPDVILPRAERQRTHVVLVSSRLRTLRVRSSTNNFVTDQTDWTNNHEPAIRRRRAALSQKQFLVLFVVVRLVRPVRDKLVPSVPGWDASMAENRGNSRGGRAILSAGFAGAPLAAG